MISINREEIIANLISNITSACKERNMSINGFCRQCNVHKSLIDNLKRNSIPSVDKLANIAVFLNISIDELIGLTVRNNCNSYEKLTESDKGKVEQFIADLLAAQDGENLAGRSDKKEL